MKLFLSHALDQNTPTYGDRDKFTISVKSEIINGLGANTSIWNFSNNHMGTHMDTPFHFIENGKKTLDYTAEEFCFERVHVIEKISDSGVLISLSEKELDLIPPDIDFMIIKTGYGKYRSLDKYHNNNPGLNSLLAGVLKKRFSKLRCIGFDFISLTSWNHREHGRLSHRSFLGDDNNFLIIEDMNLNEINLKTKVNSLILAPLRTVDGNGGPVTIIAEIDEK
jgi:arylformamidase